MYISILYFNFENFALRKFIKPNEQKKIVLCYVGPSIHTDENIHKKTFHRNGRLNWSFQNRKNYMEPNWRWKAPNGLTHKIYFLWY